MSYVFGPASTSDEQSASFQVWTGPGLFHGFEFNAPAVGVATLKVYDSSNNNLTGKRLISLSTGYAGNDSTAIIFAAPVAVTQGIYASLSGNATTYVVRFSPI